MTHPSRCGTTAKAERYGNRELNQHRSSTMMNAGILTASLTQLESAIRRTQEVHEKKYGRSGSCLAEDKLTGLEIVRQYEHKRSRTQARYLVCLRNSPQDLILGQGYPDDANPSHDKDELDEAVKCAKSNITMIAQ